MAAKHFFIGVILIVLYIELLINQKSVSAQWT